MCYLPLLVNDQILIRVHFFGKIQYWILKSKTGFCISLLNRLIQDHLDHGASKEAKNSCIGQGGVFGSFDHHDQTDPGLICFITKRNLISFRI